MASPYMRLLVPSPALGKMQLKIFLKQIINKEMKCILFLIVESLEFNL
jgi:hypothetical protein